MSCLDPTDALVKIGETQRENSDDRPEEVMNQITDMLSLGDERHARVSVVFVLPLQPDCGLTIFRVEQLGT